MIEIKIADFKSWKGPKTTLAVFATQEGLLGLSDKSADGAFSMAKADAFKGKELETTLTRPSNGVPAERLLLIGVGKKGEAKPDTFRRAAAQAVKAAERLGLEELVLLAPSGKIHALAEGLYLGTYRFDRHRTPAEDAPKPLQRVLILLPSNVDRRIAEKELTRARLYSEGTMLARDLINEPPSRMNPARLAEEALKVNKAPVSVKVFETKELEKMGMGGILGVGMGGAVPPRLVELIYKPAKKAKKVIALVGKGITFDSGGLSLKPAQSMETMKDDMSGAAAVLGIFSVLGQIKPNVEVRGYMAIAENMPGGRAQKPGDVLKAYNGKTIEVLNTDAEGRLVLADALAYASAQKPDIIIDIATLTGACVVALGHLIAAVMTNTPALAKAIITAGEAEGEKFWELPLVKEYAPDVKSKIADLQNIGKRRGDAGTIIGGLFLQEFVNGAQWAHLDIAGPSWTDSDGPLCPTGGTGNPVRSILHYLETLNG
jgi:leucyl aminopeptidase